LFVYNGKLFIWGKKKRGGGDEQHTKEQKASSLLLRVDEKILLFMMTYHYDTFRLIRCHLITCHDAKKEEETFLQHSLI